MHLTILHVTYLYSCLWFYCFDKSIARTCQKRSHFETIMFKIRLKYVENYIKTKTVSLTLVNF